jgi:hypothetical protein
MVDAPASPSAASRSLARRRNVCTRQGRLWLPGPARRAGPRVAAQAVTLARAPDALLPGWRHRQSAGVSAASCARNAGLAVRSPACAHRRQLTAVMPYILHYCAVSAPRCRPGQRRGAAELGRLASGAVTPGEPGANRQPGRPRSPPQPAGATMRSSRRLRGRGAWRPSGPACHARRPAHRPRPQGCSGVPARGEVRRAPAARSSGAYRPPACCTCLAVMPRLLAYCLDDGS